jgi:hypothetical protein
VLRVAKPAGACTAQTLLTLNGLANRANRLFRCHADLPRFFSADIGGTISQANLAIYVARLTAACLAFEERYEYLTEDVSRRAEALQGLDRLRPDN